MWPRSHYSREAGLSVKRQPDHDRRHNKHHSPATLPEYKGATTASLENMAEEFIKALK